MEDPSTVIELHEPPDHYPGRPSRPVPTAVREVIPSASRETCAGEVVLAVWQDFDTWQLEGNGCRLPSGAEERWEPLF